MPDEQLHVIVFADSFLETSGVGTYYRTLMDWCRAQDGVSMTVVCPDPAGGQDYPVGDGVIAIRPRFRCRFPLYKDVTVGHYPLRRLREIIDAAPDPKVVHIASSGPLGIAASRAARKCGVPMVGCYHTNMRERGRVYGQKYFGRAGRWLGEQTTRLGDRLAYGACAALYAPTPAVGIHPGEFYDGCTQVITNPIDTERFQPAEAHDGWFRQRFQRDDRILAIAVGRIAKEKSPERLCKLIVPHDDIQLVFVGDGPERAHLEKRYGVKFTGFLKGRYLVEAYQQADVYVQVSMSETFGLCLVEALSCGLPAVALRAPGVTAELEPGNGVDVLEADELDRMASRCVELVRDRATYAEYRDAARRFALRCAAEGVLPQWLALHQQVALSASAAP